jgi:hypothetical protein
VVVLVLVCLDELIIANAMTTEITPKKSIGKKAMDVDVVAKV